jgi:hypothetical protein
MIPNSFLSKIATIVLLQYNKNSTNTTIVLPNKRAKVFLLNELQLQSQETIFAPEIISIEDFVQDISGIRSIDNIELLFQFYSVYCSVTESVKQESFENFANWAKTLLQDFNEIDRYLLEPDKILKYLENIKEVEHWSVSADKKTDLIEKYLAFWKLLPTYYHALYAHLKNAKIGYQGLIYREAVSNLKSFSFETKETNYLFAGFNALNHAEEEIVQYLLSIKKAQIYWDIDTIFMQDFYHDAGLFTRRFKKEWRHYKSNPFEFIVNDFSEPKNIEIIGTPKSIGQAKIVGDIVNSIKAKNLNLNNVAVVLGEENLLLPILYSLPSSVNALNITMGYSSKNNPVQILVSKLFKMHSSAISRNAKSYVFYYKEVLDVATHPLLDGLIKAENLVSVVNKNNFTFIPHKKILELNGKTSEIFDLIFTKWEDNPIVILETIATILIKIKDFLNTDIEEEKITKAFLFSVFKVINKLQSYFENNPNINKVETLYAIYKQVIDVAEVSFEGEPLNGLQVMGVLESRVLDFDTVIITSVNEGKFPAGKSMNSFIPYDVKLEYGLPTFKEKDAIYTYHFYHLLQRAKNIYLLYNTESDGLDAGERSRFITQLLIEKQTNHTITERIINPNVPEIAYQPMVIEKSEKVMLRLQEIAVKGFSPSALVSYIRNPKQFYFQKILSIRETDEVEENIAVNTLGTIIHGALEELYKPFIGKIITEQNIENCFKLLDKEIIAQFKLVYKEGEIKQGRNLLAFEVAKRNVFNFLKIELQNIKDGDTIKIIALEQTIEHEIDSPKLPFKVLLKGNVDRIEIRNEIVRIIDYKTGKVEKRNVVLKDWNGLTANSKNDKIIQILAYAYMYQEQLQGQKLEVGIISFKNLRSGFLSFEFKADKNGETEISTEILENFESELIVLLQEILDQAKPFEEEV